MLLLHGPPGLLLQVDTRVLAEHLRAEEHDVRKGRPIRRLLAGTWLKEADLVVVR